MPGLVSLREVPELPPASEVVAAVTSCDHNALIKIVTDLVAQKPKSVQEALKLVSTLQEKITEWALSELPEKDSVLAGLKMVESVSASLGCLPCLRK
jgi:hypothetical protein